MRIHDYDWKKFAVRGGCGLFAELRLFCPYCVGQNIVQTTGFEVGKDRTIFAAAQEIIKEIVSGEYLCEGCGIQSIIAPIKLRDYNLEHLMSYLNEEFFDSLVVSPAPAKALGICIN